MSPAGAGLPCFLYVISADVFTPTSAARVHVNLGAYVLFIEI